MTAPAAPAAAAEVGDDGADDDEDRTVLARSAGRRLTSRPAAAGN